MPRHTHPRRTHPMRAKPFRLPEQAHEGRFVGKLPIRKLRDERELITLTVSPQQFEALLAGMQHIYAEYDRSDEVASLLDELARISEHRAESES